MKFSKKIYRKTLLLLEINSEKLNKNLLKNFSALCNIGTILKNILVNIYIYIHINNKVSMV